MGVSVTLRKQLKGFRLDVGWEAANELVALFGFSGSGKTMTLQMIVGLVRPDAGRVASGSQIYFDSSAAVDAKPQERRFGYVMQNPALFPQMTVRQNIAYGLPGVARAMREKGVAEMISLFRLGHISQAYPDRISGGQKQRVALARALIRRPDALMLDEPFPALDWPVRLKMQALVGKTRAEFDIPVVLVTHDFREVRNMADRVIVYADGKVVQSGAPGEINSSPASAQVRRLLAAG